MQILNYDHYTDALATSIANQRLVDDNRQDFIDGYVAKQLPKFMADSENIVEAIESATTRQTDKLMAILAEYAKTQSGAIQKQLAACLDDIIDEHLEKMAEQEWEKNNA
jgi:hypothetical protein